MVAGRQMMMDENYEPQYGERVPYVITRGEPNSRLVDRAVAAHELLENKYNAEVSRLNEICTDHKIVATSTWMVHTIFQEC
jgi:DNA polymerase elongation subunit (family B)